MSPRNSVGLFNSSGSLAIFTAILRASWHVSIFPVERLLASSSTSFCPPPSFTTKQAEASEVRVESLRQARHRSSCQGQRYCWLAGVVTAGVRLDW
jgi:hypothetical protein